MEEDIREIEARAMAQALRRKAEDRDGWRRFWAGLRPDDRQLLKEIVTQHDN